MTTIKKNLKPIDIDAYFKYRCPSPKCGQEKWINLAEVRTKNFKIVCYCGIVIKPRLISAIDIVYSEDTIEIVKNTIDIEIPLDILDKCVSVLKTYGFTEEESKELIKNTYKKNQSSDWKIILKQAIESIGVQDEYQADKI